MNRRERDRRITLGSVLITALLLSTGAHAQPAAAGEVLDLSFATQDLELAVLDLEHVVQDMGGQVQTLAVTETETELRMELASDVLFEFDSAELQPKAQQTMKQVAAFVRDNATGEVRVEGHTDARGSDAYNQALSERRAQAVLDWLSTREGLNGMAGVSFVSKGFGETRPVAPNARPDGADDPAGRQKNRRVEIVVRK